MPVTKNLSKPESHPPVIWMTGFSGSGKSTLAEALAAELRSEGKRVEVLDGDVIREALSNFAFDAAERNRNVRTVGVMAGLLQRNGVYVIAALISPYRESRDFVRGLCSPFFEIHLCTPLGKCEERDPKGLYRRARSGDIKHFTGIDDPYEDPLSPELRIDTSTRSMDDCIREIRGLLA